MALEDNTCRGLPENKELLPIADGICDDELGVFHIKSKEDTLYYAFPHSHLNYDKYRQDDYKYTPPPAVDMPND